MNLLYKRSVEDLKKLFDNKRILITGGTGSFGNKLIEIIVKETKPKEIVIFSRDEFKQYHMSKKFGEEIYSCVTYFIGDIRDFDRVDEAFRNIDIVFHAAALKHVPIIEYNPSEAIKTNINGTENIVNAAIKNNVERVIALSTDKCVSPANLYGATKLCLEKLIISGNYKGGSNVKFSVLRYGNVFASRGSVVPLFVKQSLENKFTITDEKMTRFTLILEEAINFVLDCSINMIGGEVFIPKLPSYNICQLARVINKDAKIEITGIRPGEKLHEAMIGESESYLAIENKDKYIIIPPIYTSNHINFTKKYGDKFLKNGLIYSSDNNELISNERLLNMVNLYKKENDIN